MSSLRTVFDPRANSLNAVRLALAVGVILWHSFPLTGTASPARPLVQLLGSGFVDGFFAISGFLILSSWVRNPHWWPYLRARVLRIMPGYYVCLIATAVVFAPLSTLIPQASQHVQISSAASFVYRNALLRINQYNIGGTLDKVPYPHVWNGSLWTLWWEFGCYLGVLFLGITGLLRFRVVVPAAFVLSVLWLIAITVKSTGNYYLDNAPRFVVMFLAGSLIYLLQDRMRSSWSWVAGAAIIVAACLWLPDYRIIAAVPLAYLVINIGALLKNPRFVLRNDISYGMYVYAFPVQQILAGLGVDRLGVLPFFVISTVLTVPVAAASWFLIEKPALRLKGSPKLTTRLKRTPPVALPVTTPGIAGDEVLQRPAHRR